MLDMKRTYHFALKLSRAEISNKTEESCSLCRSAMGIGKVAGGL